MRAAQKGDIVVVMKPCRVGCGVCTPLLGRTALVAKDYNGQYMSLRLFNNQGTRSGFQPQQLFVTGLTAL